jgi:membrane protease YdiL (CAAX protease family)
MGLIFGLYFTRRRRLWPIVVAHAVTDFLSLGGFL